MILSKDNVTRAVVRFLGAFGLTFAILLQSTKASDLKTALASVIPAAALALEKLLGPS